MSKLKSSKVYLVVAVAVVVGFLAKWQSLGISDQSCARQIGMGLSEFIPNCKGAAAEWTTNSLGLRAQEPSINVRESMYTVLYLGWADPRIDQGANSALMPSFLEKHLNSVSLHRTPIRVIDGSGPSTGGIPQLQSMLKLVRAYRPQMVVYLFVPQSEHIQYAALERYGFAESPVEVERDLIRLSWAAKMDRDPVATILRPTMADLRELARAVEQENAKLFVVWPGTGLAFAAWNLRLPPTIESLVLQFVGALKIIVGSSAERIRLLLNEHQIQYFEVPDLGVLFGRRMAFSESEQVERSARVAKRIGEIILHENGRLGR